YVNEANRAIYQDKIPKADFILQHGYMSFKQVITSVWFLGPIALCIAAVAFYIFLIWYRDWFGKNTFIYRLLMLPTARINVFLAKASAIFLMVLGLVGIQLILLPIEQMVMQWMVPLELRTDLTLSQIVSGSPGGFLQLLLPKNFIQFLLNYGIGFMMVFHLFTAILFERSFRFKGIVFGVLYYILINILFVLPILIELFFTRGYFYLGELFVIEFILVLMVTVLSIGMSHYLLYRKINV